MQIMAKLGFEFGLSSGLGLVDGEVKPIECKGKIPHMGFNKIKIVDKNDLFHDVEDSDFYFMHSYEMVNYTDVSALTEFKGHSFVSAIQKQNLYGVQFHPEKSREAGIKLLSNFIEL
jgi:imidazole glycerol phosphate synthase glutamine amidotransferase subunit